MAKHLYVWRGNDRQGQQVNGEIVADNHRHVQEQLRAQRIRTTHIHRKFQLSALLKHTTKRDIPRRDITRLTRQLATLLHSGVPLLQALQILNRGEAPSALKTLILDVHAQVEAGIALSQALQRHPEFDALYCNLVAVGEVSGMLDTMLERLAQHLEKTEALRATLRSALIYPCAVLSVAGVVLTLILIFVVPAFQNIFSSFGAELPWLTRMVIQASEGLQHYGVATMVCIVATGWWLNWRMRKNTTWQHQLHKLCLQAPIAGPLIRHACAARWTRTLATLFSAGLPLTDALSSVSGVTGNLLFQAATHNIQIQLLQGTSLSQALEHAGNLFPPMVAQMCAIGEESGALDHMLTKTAEHYEREVDNTVARLSTLLEPFIMVVLGLLIGGLVMALYLPIFQLGQVV
jgi:type IV pilus assembly protein PilC